MFELLTRLQALVFPILLWWMGLQLEMAFLLWLFVTRMVRSISVLLVPLKEIFRVRLLFLGVL
ncbi:hypothetical protein A7D27_19535 [Pseudomonas sp. 1D4]|nr:hypothetical protein A7D27_19535 [Pseudomonas sp. 1D4]OEC53170.1 hypothetical protein A9G05_21150 [Pseudomonas sp. ENNP23]